MLFKLKLLRYVIPTNLLAVFLMTVLVQSASAQFSFSELKLCTLKKDGAERLACFDRVTEKLRTNAGVTDVETYQSSGKGIDPATGIGAVYSGAGFAQRAPAVVSRAAPSVISREPKQANDFGLPSDRSNASEIKVNVVEAKLNELGRWVLVTEGGQVWRQTGAQKLRLAEAPFTAQIEKSRFGSHWMQIGSGGKATKLKVARTQ